MTVNLENLWLQIRQTAIGRLLLQLLAVPYALLTGLRNWCYDRGLCRTCDFPVPVISVGNVTLGGSGKTPLVMEVVRQLKQREFCPVVVSRGYRSSGGGCRQVVESSSASEVGDEPLLIYRRLGIPVVVAADRVEALEYVLSKKLGDIVVLDDGFQHRRLARNFDLVSMAVGAGGDIEDIISDRHFPAGRLREKRESALRRADAVVIMSRTTARVGAALVSKIKDIIPEGMALYSARYSLKGIKRLADGSPLQEGVAVVGFCGIGDPEVFRQTLELAGCRVQDLRVFPDHHPVSEKELEELKCRFPGVPLVCTEKDAVKIPPGSEEGIHVVEVEYQLNAIDDLMNQIVACCL